MFQKVKKFEPAFQFFAPHKEMYTSYKGEKNYQLRGRLGF